MKEALDILSKIDNETLISEGLKEWLTYRENPIRDKAIIEKRLEGRLIKAIALDANISQARIGQLFNHFSRFLGRFYEKRIGTFKGVKL